MLVVLAKSLVIALVAGVAVWLPFAAIGAMTGDIGLFLLPLALLGSFAVGLPVALLCFFLAGKELRRAPSTVFLMANCAGFVLLTSSAVLGDLLGLIMLGVPSFVAANIFAALGWFWILKPERDQEREAMELPG